MIRVRILPAAEAEVTEACAFYEGRREGLGMDFLDAVDVAIERIRAMPETFPIWRTGERYRFLRLKRFPFVVFYRVVDSRIEVVAVAHAKRRPGYWATR